MTPPPKPQGSRAPSIGLLAPVVLALPVILVSLVLGVLAVSQSRRAMEDLATQIVDQIEARVGARISDLAQTASRVSDQNAYLVEIGAFDPDHLRAWLPTMRRQMAIFTELNGIAWGDEQGFATWLVSYPGEQTLEYAIKDDRTAGLIEQYALAPDGTLSEQPLRALEYDPRQRPWYRAGIDSRGSERGAAWSPVYSWAREDGSGATLGISYSRAIIDAAGNARGVLDTELELHSVSRFLGSLEIGETGSAIIVDREGELVAASTGQRLITPDGAQLAATAAEDPATAGAARAVLERVGSFAEARAPVRTVADVQGARAWIGCTPIDGDSGLDWLLVTTIPERDLLGRVAEARRRAIIAAVVAVLVTLAAGAGLARLAVRPILRLRDHVHKVGKGDLEREVHLTGTRELAQLSTDINRMARDLLDRARMRESLRVAMDVQQALLPERPPKVRALDIAGFSEYCDETGGDYFDFLSISGIDEGRVEVALGDVMGHGVAAALLMASARAVLRSRWRETGELAELLAYVNRQIVPDTKGARFMTLLLMTIDGPAGSLRWATAGQQCGLLYDPATDAFTELPGAGLPLGLIDDAAYENLTKEGVAPGSVLLVTTDGLFEAHNAAGEAYGWKRIQDSLRNRAKDAAADIAKGLHDDLLAFCGDLKPEDDVTLVVVRFTGSEGQR